MIPNTEFQNFEKIVDETFSVTHGNHGTATQFFKDLFGADFLGWDDYKRCLPEAEYNVNCVKFKIKPEFLIKHIWKFSGFRIENLPHETDIVKLEYSSDDWDSVAFMISYMLYNFKKDAK